MYFGLFFLIGYKIYNMDSTTHNGFKVVFGNSLTELKDYDRRELENTSKQDLIRDRKLHTGINLISKIFN